MPMETPCTQAGARTARARRIAKLFPSVPRRDWAGLVMTFVIPCGVPLLLAVAMGIPLAVLIVKGQFHLVFAFLLLIPSVVLFNTYPLAALIIWLLLAPFLQTTPNAAYRMVYWMVHRAMPVAALGVAILSELLRVTRNDSRKRRPIRLGRAEFVMVAYLGWATLNILWFHPGPISYLYLLYDRVFVPMALYILIRITAPDEQDVWRLLPVALVIVLIESIAGILSWFAPQLLPPDWLGYQGARTTGSLGYPHAYTTTLIFFSFLLFQAAMSRESGPVRFALFAVFGFSALCVFLSFSRGSWLGGLAAMVGLLVMYPKTVLRLMAVLLVLMALLGSGVLSDQMAFARERMNSEDTAADRWVIWNAGLQMIKTQPFFGWGYGNYRKYAQQFQVRTHNHVVSYAHASHNSYIAIAAEMGLPALALFLFPAWWWLMLTRKVWRRIPQQGFWSRALLVILWMVILDHLVVNFFSDMQHSTYGMGMWWVTLGLIANMVERYLQPGDMELPAWLRRAALS